MFKRIIIALTVITIASLVSAIIVAISTSRPYYYNHGMIEGLDNLLPVCPTSFFQPLRGVEQATLKSGEAPFSIGEGVSSEANCSFSSYYFVLVDVFFVSLLFLCFLLYWKFVQFFYTSEVKQFNLAVRALYDILVSLPFLIFCSILIFVIKLNLN
ncbi:MAG: hypothetical protein AAB963_00865 [Patescibacteria group bacterium]